MKKRPWRFFFWILGVCVLVMAVSYGCRARGARALAAYRKQLRAAGEKLTVDALLPPLLRPEDNATYAFRQANASWRTRGTLLETNQPPAMRMVAPGKAMVGTAQPFVINDGTNSWEELQNAVARNEDAFKTLAEIVDKPNLDFQLDYSVSVNSVMFFHLSDLKRATQLSNAAASLALHRGDAHAAADHIRVMLALVQAERHERWVISQLVRIAMAHIAAAGTWEYLQSTAANEEDLARLQRDWSELEFLTSCEAALEMERVKLDEMFEEMRKSSATFRQVLSAGGPAPGSTWYERAAASALLKTKENVWRNALSYPDQLRGLKGEQVMIEAVRRAQRDGYFAPAFAQQKEQFAKLGIVTHTNDSDAWLAKVGNVSLVSISESQVLSLERFLNRICTMQTTRELVITAIALKRYQLRHGSLPENLSALVPDYLPVIPRDPIDGAPLRYRLREGGFLLYSIGQDNHDNGGDPASEKTRINFSWQWGNDIVWPQPATAEEVATFLADPRRKK